MKSFWKTFISSEEGATAVEYAIMVSLIAAVVVLAVTAIGTGVNANFEYVAEKVQIPS